MVERVDFYSDDEFQQALQDEEQSYFRQQQIDAERDQQNEAQLETVTKLENALSDTRQEFQGISIRDVARIIKKMLDKTEYEILVKELSAEDIPIHEDDLPF